MRTRIIPLMMLIGLILCHTGPTLAQDSVQTEPISLTTAIEMALKNNSEYRLSLHEQKIAREKVNEVWGTIFPSLESEAALIRQYAEMGLLSTSEGQYDIKVVQVKFGFNPGSFYHSLRASKTGYRAAVEKSRRIRNNLIYNTIKSYFNIILSKEAIDLRKSAIIFLDENLKNVENQYKTGSVPRYDLLQAKVKLQSQEPYLIEARNNHKLAIDFFNYTLGVEGSRYTADAGTLAHPENPGEKGSTEERIDVLTRDAMKNRPEILLLKMKREGAEDARGAYRSMYLWPVFTAGGAYGFNKNLVTKSNLSSILGDRDWQQNWQVRIAATYRWGALLPMDTYKVKERQEELAMKKAEMELDRLNRAIAISIKSSYYNLVSSYERILAHRESVETATEGLRIARESSRAGVIKNSDLLAAQFALTKAKIGYINAVNKYYLSLASLQKETGVENYQMLMQGE
ncbi:MAG: TolC family protein [Spirochaetes bacterium]|nr:TolC family protein [Spirochaetota bacterium]